MPMLPPNWTPKVVAIDIDGTITDENKKLHTEAVKALRRLEQAGVPVILATGNVRAIVYGLWRFIGLSGPMVCENGGVVWHPDHGPPIKRGDGKEAQKAADWLSTQIEGLDPQGITTNAWRESEWCLSVHEDLSEVVRMIQSSPWKHYDVVRTGFAIHLMEPQISKGEGLKIALKMLNLTPEDTLAIGDAPNDLPMFELAHWSIAVGGAFESVITKSDYTSQLPHGEAIKPIVDAILETID